MSSRRRRDPDPLELITFIADHESLTLTCDEFSGVSEERLRSILRAVVAEISGDPRLACLLRVGRQRGLPAQRQRAARQADQRHISRQGRALAGALPSGARAVAEVPPLRCEACAARAELGGG